GSVGPSRRANEAAPRKCPFAGLSAMQNPGYYAAEARPTLHSKRTVCLHLSLEQKRICRNVHGAFHRSHERGRYSQPGKLSAPARVRHVSQRKISEPPQRKAGYAEALISQAEFSGHP